MDVPNTEFWSVPRAAIWVATRDPAAATAKLSGNGIGERTNADTWLDEHRGFIWPNYQGWFRCNAAEMARSPFDLASDEIVRAVWDGKIALYDDEGKEAPKARLARFRNIIKVRNWIFSSRRFSLQAKAVLAQWPSEPRPANPVAAMREQAARDFLKSWKPRDMEKPFHGAWLAAVRDLAFKYNVSEDAIKKSTGKFITREIERRRKQSGKAA